MKPLNIAHISDLHFSKFIPSISQFFSKRWIGNLNLLFSRGRVYVPDQLFLLPRLFKKLGVDTVAITGDLSTTSLLQELALAKQLVEEFEVEGMQVLFLPGNHDQYTRASYRNGNFYSYFEDPSLQKDKVSTKQLNDKWWAILLDTALATNWISSKGLFRKEMESTLIDAIEKIPDDASIIVFNHFPLFSNDSKRKELKRADALQAILKKAFPKVKLYLHGHTHRHCIADLRANQHPIILDSGSTAHKKIGTWNFIQIENDQCRVQPHGIFQGEWQKLDNEQTFTL